MNALLHRPRPRYQVSTVVQRSFVDESFTKQRARKRQILLAACNQLRDDQVVRLETYRLAWIGIRSRDGNDAIFPTRWQDWR
jgi:hypothetical protein